MLRWHVRRERPGLAHERTASSAMLPTSAPIARIAVMRLQAAAPDPPFERVDERPEDERDDHAKTMSMMCAVLLRWRRIALERRRTRTIAAAATATRVNPPAFRAARARSSGSSAATAAWIFCWVASFGGVPAGK